MIQRLLIANRGEIACRILATARRLGITGIAVYSDADRNARHVRLADEAHRLGPAPAAQSYLDVDRVIYLATRVRADAVHPGYGFLSENAEFAARCEAAGLRFVGPPAAAIRAMGSKSEAKHAMRRAGVPVAPGYEGADQSVERLREEAERIGYPLIIKASAGGGGKGMQVVHDTAALVPAIESARRLARAAFADDRLLIERYFPAARHVEVQVFADARGEVLTLFDRDCSVQRRHQKIVEEAPAPGLRPEVRAAMAQAAVTTARAVGYVGAGTVEFLLDETQGFYFMEMNTRLQVEHPVTEFITGIDLVEWQIRVARGEPLPLRQDEVRARGAAVEARLYAEDPARDYLPSVGRIDHLRWPDVGADLRIDAGVDAGDEVSDFYDPLLAKVVAWGTSREAATARLARALDAVEILGVTTNRALLAGILADPAFVSGPVTTAYLGARGGALPLADADPAPIDRALAALWLASAAADPGALWSGTTGWRLGQPARSRWCLQGEEVRVEVCGGGSYRIEDGAGGCEARLVARAADALDAEIDGARYRVRVIGAGGRLHLLGAGRRVSLGITGTDDHEVGAGTAEEGSLTAPLPGTLVAVHVAPGQVVARGAPLATVEAMKMEHTLMAPHAGRVLRIGFAVGDRVPAGATLLELAAESADAPPTDAPPAASRSPVAGD